MHLDDAEAIAHLMNACSIAEGGVAITSADDTLSDLEEPGRDLGVDNALVVTAEGRIAGCLSLDVAAPFTEIEALGFVHPDFWGRGVGSFLIGLGEERIRARLDRAPEGHRVLVRVSRWTENDAARSLFEAHGYGFARRFWQMTLELLAAPPEPRYPDGVEVRQFVRGRDERPVHAALAEAFEDHWGQSVRPLEQWVHSFVDTDASGFDAGLWFVAVDGDEVAGAAVCRAGSPWDPDLGLVRELGVRRSWRGRGIGLALLLSAFGEFHRRGFPRAGLAVDSDNPTGATRLYERAGMRVERVWETWEKEIRPGTPGIRGPSVEVA